MKLKSSILLLFLLSAVGSFAQSKAEKEQIKNEVEEMFVKDQQYRWMIMYGETDEQKLNTFKATDDLDKMKRMREVMYDKEGTFKALKDSLWALQKPLDSANFVRLKAIIEMHGYPEGYASNEKMSTVLIHNSSRIIQSNFLAKLKEEVNKKHISGMVYATIYDRTMVETDQPELYYVMLDFDKDGNQHYHTPIDMKATNAARKEIGMSPFKQLSKEGK